MNQHPPGEQSPSDPTSPNPLERRRRTVRRLLRAETIYIIALMSFAVLALSAHANAYFAWDLIAARALQTVPLPGISGLMRAASVFGNGWVPFAITAVTVIAFLAFRRRSEAICLTLSAGGGAIVNRVLKVLIGRPRPTRDLVTVFGDLGSQSFPSGHVTFYVCYFGFLFFAAYALLPRGSRARRLALTLAALPVLLVGVSRVYLGAHWPSDTLGAYLVGGVWLAFSLDVYRRRKQRVALHEEREK